MNVSKNYFALNENSTYAEIEGPNGKTVCIYPIDEEFYNKYLKASWDKKPSILTLVKTTHVKGKKNYNLSVRYLNYTDAMETGSLYLYGLRDFMGYDLYVLGEELKKYETMREFTDEQWEEYHAFQDTMVHLMESYSMLSELLLKL